MEERQHFSHKVDLLEPKEKHECAGQAVTVHCPLLASSQALAVLPSAHLHLSHTASCQLRAGRHLPLYSVR